jgi:hypothetical protein
VFARLLVVQLLFIWIIELERKLVDYAVGVFVFFELHSVLVAELN